MPLIFSVLCEPSYFCVSPCTEREKRRRKPSRNLGTRESECAKNKRTGRAILQRSGRQAIEKAWSTQRVKNKQEETEWTRNRTAESGLYEWNKRIESIQSFQKWLFTMQFFCLHCSAPALEAAFSVTSSEGPHPHFQHILACAGVQHDHRNLSLMPWSNPDC